MPDDLIQPATQQQGGAPPAVSQQPAPAESEQQPNGKGWEAAKQYKAELEATKSKLASYEAAAKAAEEKRMAETGQHKELAERKSQEAAEIRSKYENALKHNALLAEAQNQGLRNTAFLRLADTSKLSIDGEQVKGAAEAIQAIREIDATLFGNGKSAPPFPTPQAIPGGTQPDLRKASVEDVHRMTPEQRKTYLEQVRSAR